VPTYPGLPAWATLFRAYGADAPQPQSQ